MTPTPEQEAIIEAARSSSDNLLISALAGAAKTSTLVMIAKALPSTPIVALSFNVRIREEMQSRLPGNCEAMTLNSLGHRVWSAAIGKRLQIDKSKTYRLVTAAVEELGPSDKSLIYENFNTILRAIDGGKTAGYVPEGFKHQIPHKSLMTDAEYNEWLDEIPTDLEWDLIQKVYDQGLRESIAGVCDYNDQILMPTMFHGVFPNYPLVLADESQDFSALNHAMLRKLVRKRIIAVGDECQSIYGFRGAHENSMRLLQTQFKMRELILSVSFRCPRLVVEEARWRAPHMQYPEWAIEGEVTRLEEWDQSHLPISATVICRNNAPLFHCAIRLLKAGRAPEIIGKDIGKALIKIMRKFSKSDLDLEALHSAITKWAEAKKTKSRDKEAVDDQADCMRVFADQGQSLDRAIAYAEHVFSVAGPVKLMTVHKAKGLEFEHVFILDADLIRMDRPQDRNVKYVAQTRSKSTLTYISTTGYREV